MENTLIWIDDGYEETFKHALPILNKYNLHAVWSIPVALLGKELEGGKIISKEQLKELAKTQIIASHTLTHRNLHDLSYTEAEKEVINSKEELEKLIGKKIIYFVYPYDRIPDKKVINLVKKEYKFIRPFFNYSFHLIAPQTYKYYPYFITPEQFEEYIKYEKL